jgi:ATP-binding cassette, subfamily C, bacterial
LKHIQLILCLLGDLFRFKPAYTILTFCLILARSLTAGVGLLFILPLFQHIGLSLGSQAGVGGARYLNALFEAMHMPIGLVGILCVYSMVLGVLALLVYGEQIITSSLQQNYIKHLRTKLHRQLLETPWPFFLARKMSDILYSLTTQVQGVLLCNHQLLNLISHLFLVIVYTALACMLSFQMTVLAVVAAGLLLCFMLPLHGLTSKAGARSLKQNQVLFQAISEQFSALKTMKGSGLETRFINQLLMVNTSLAEDNQRVITMTAKSKLLYSVGSVILLSVLLYVALTIIHVPLGTLLLLLIVFSRVLPMVSSAQQMYQRILHQLPAYQGIQALLADCKAALLPDTGDSQPIRFKEHIKIKQLCFAYPSKPQAFVLDNISMQLKKNSITAFIGPSGAGKSTLADLITGLLQPTQGEIWIDDQRLTPRNSSTWQQQIAYVTQDVFLFNASVRDNLTWFGSKQSDAMLWEALDAAAAYFVRDLDLGLDTLLGDRGVRLSGGERQRIALARALLMKPSLLVLDESTNALGSAHLALIQSALLALKGKMTIVIISHQAEMCAFATQQIILDPRTKQERMQGEEQYTQLDADKTAVF